VTFSCESKDHFTFGEGAAVECAERGPACFVVGDCLVYLLLKLMGPGGACLYVEFVNDGPGECGDDFFVDADHAAFCVAFC